MSDYLVEWGQNRAFRKTVSSLGLPIPVPQKLRRGDGAWGERPLQDRLIAVGGAGDLQEALSHALPRAGASAVIGDDVEAAAPWRERAGAWARPLKREEDSMRYDALVFDATRLRTAADLRGLYDFFHPRIRRIRSCARVLVLGRPPEEQPDPAAAAAAAALEGFTRSVGKEIGRKGATANLLRVAEGAEDRLEPALRFLLSARSAFISGQPLTISAQVASAGEPATVRPLDGAAALVTGAARGIGAATARRLAAEGARVLCVDLDDAPLTEVAAACGGAALACDITAADAPARIAERLAALGEPRVIVHNAGVTRDRTLGKMSEQSWDLTLDVNLGAILRLNEALLPALGAGGRVVLLASIAGLAGNVGQTNYAASKAAVAGLARHLGPALAPRGIAVNAIAPGFIETRMTAAIPAATREPARRLSSLSQGGLPLDIAEAVTFLASPGAAGLCGQVLRVCGGSLVGA